MRNLLAMLNVLNMVLSADNLIILLLEGFKCVSEQLNTNYVELSAILSMLKRIVSEITIDKNNVAFN